MSRTLPKRSCRVALGRLRWLTLLLIGACMQINAAAGDEARGGAAAPPPDFSTMRPIRTPQPIEISVGQGEGDLQGGDDKIIQAAVDYVAGFGGGVVRVLPGTYAMRNAVFLRSGVTLRGCGDKTVLKRAPSVSSPLVRESDWYECAVEVADAKGFTPGCGVALSATNPDWPHTLMYTVTAVQGNALYLDRRLDKDFWMKDGAKARAISSILCAHDADDVLVEDIVLDGNRAENEYIDGNFAAAVYLRCCDRWTFKNVIAQNYNGDGFSPQVCNDVRFENCQANNNAGRGFHPGSGVRRSVFIGCNAKGNLGGFFWCWGVCDGRVEDCTFSDNLQYGMSYGHRDTDNVVRRCAFERNGQVGVVFRKEGVESRHGNRNRIEECLVRDNGGEKGGCGVDIQGKTRDIVIAQCRFENSPNGKQNIAIRISPDAKDITLDGNTFTGCPVEVQDLRVEATQ